MNERKIIKDLSIGEQVYFVVEGMQKYGGGFMKALSECIIRADHNNLAKIRMIWSDEWNKYFEMGKKLLEDEDNSGEK